MTAIEEDPLLFVFPRDEFWADGTPLIDRDGKPRKPLSKGNPNHDPATGRFTSAPGGALVSDEPVEPGTRPIPAGHVRIYHYSSAPADKLRNEGLLFGSARGESYGEPNFVWGSTYQPDLTTHNVVEFHVPVEDLSRSLNYPDKDADLNEWMKGHHHVGLKRDVRPEEILAVHEPWHDKYLYAKNDPDILRATLAGEHDHLLGAPGYEDYARAIERLKAEHSAKSLRDRVSKSIKGRRR